MSRRGLLAAGGSLGAGALLAACGPSSGPASDPPPGRGATAATAGPWTFTDDRPKTVRLKRVPTRLVAYVGAAAALHDYGIECAGVFGPTRLKNGAADAQAGDLDVRDVTVLGNTWGEFGIEKYAALNPGLLISHIYQPPALWYVPDQSAGKILALAPSVGIKVAGVPLTTPLHRYAQLAAALGADLASAANSAQKARFDKASADLRTAARTARAAGVKVLAASASTESFYVSTPASAADLTYYRGLGVDFVVPTRVRGGFFETLSWETADRYPADVIMLDDRTATLQPADLTGRPTWNRLPAVAAGQVTGWPSEPIFSYAKCADRMEALAEVLTAAKKVS